MFPQRLDHLHYITARSWYAVAFLDRLEDLACSNENAALIHTARSTDGEFIKSNYLGKYS